MICYLTLLSLIGTVAAMGQTNQTIALDLARGQLHQLQLDDRHRLRLAHTAAGYVATGEFVSAVTEAGARRLRWQEQWTAPQRWDKHPANPVYTPAMTGWNNWVNGVSIIPLPDGKRYRMYYAGREGQGIGFAEAAVSDPVTWKDHGGPVLKPRTDNWEGNLINQPRVVMVTDTHWRMYYTGWGFKGPGSPWATGLAESFDAGITWKRYQDDPIIERGDEKSPDGGAAMVPSLLRVNGKWLMWYTGVMVSPQGNQNIHLCFAESDDGIRWTKYAGNPVITDDFSDGSKRTVISRCYVRYDAGVFQIWYSFAKPHYRIFYAESLDGRAWEHSPVAPVLPHSPKPAWDDQNTSYPEVQVVDGQYRMWYCGNGFGSVGYATGVAETGVKLFVRTGATAQPDATWSDWQEIKRDGQIPPARFLQVKAQLHSTNPVLSPALNSITIE